MWMFESQQPVVGNPHKETDNPCTQYLGIWDWVIGIIVQALGKYMIVGYLDP